MRAGRTIRSASGPMRRRRSPGIRRGTPPSTRPGGVRPLVHRGDLQHLLQRRSTATWKAGRGEQTAVIYDSPVTGAKRRISYGELRDTVATFAARACRPRHRQGRPRHHLHADDPRGDRRHARLRPARRDPLGGVRRLCRPRAGAAASTTPARSCMRHRLVRHRAEPHRFPTCRWPPRRSTRRRTGRPP